MKDTMSPITRHPTNTKVTGDTRVERDTAMKASADTMEASADTKEASADLVVDIMVDLAEDTKVELEDLADLADTTAVSAVVVDSADITVVATKKATDSANQPYQRAAKKNDQPKKNITNKPKKKNQE